MHNVRMKSLVRVLVAVVGLTTVLAGCTDAKDPDAKKSPGTPAATAQTQVPVPDGVELTEYGTDLTFGQSANVAYSPNDERQTVLQLTVNGVTQGTIDDLSGYTLEERTRASTPYYVKVTVKNVGQGDVGQTPIPLFLVDNRNTLISASSFTNSFTKCPSVPLPTTFAPQASLATCLVFLAPDHGTMTGVSFRAVQEFAPIVWTGELTVPKKKKKDKKS
ncbi:hypothetical protein ABIE44_000283 [Marmoricola sp. OAE513]